MTSITSSNGDISARTSLSSEQNCKLNRSSSLTAASAAAAESSKCGSLAKGNWRSSTLPYPPKSAPLTSTSFESQTSPILETSNETNDLLKSSNVTINTASSAGSIGNTNSMSTIDVVLPPTPASDRSYDPLSIRSSPALSRTSSGLNNVCGGGETASNAATVASGILPAEIEYLSSIPVAQWGYADVADFFRVTLSLPIDLSRETANFIEEQKLDGAQLTKMSELDLRRSGVNTQWCHRIITTLGLVKERQHRRRLQLQEDGDLSLAAYIEDQFTHQLELLRRVAVSQDKAELALKEHNSRGLSMAKRIARLEYALEHRHNTVQEPIAEASEEYVFADRSNVTDTNQTSSFFSKGVDHANRLFIGKKSTKRQVPNDGPSSLIFVAQGFAAGIAATLLILRLIR
ncbi:hypothetical protein BDF19DRAFT_433895 [Syncephalis fuscata]|nr:hypothetical protein BDF19DRAFT_433895 [Syncephalis fuscata]